MDKIDALCSWLFMLILNYVDYDVVQNHDGSVFGEPVDVQ